MTHTHRSAPNGLPVGDAVSSRLILWHRSSDVLYKKITSDNMLGVCERTREIINSTSCALTSSPSVSMSKISQRASSSSRLGVEVRSTYIGARLAHWKPTQGVCTLFVEDVLLEALIFLTPNSNLKLVIVHSFRLSFQAAWVVVKQTPVPASLRTRCLLPSCSV